MLNLIYILAIPEGWFDTIQDFSAREFLVWHAHYLVHDNLEYGRRSSMAFVCIASGKPNSIGQLKGTLGHLLAAECCNIMISGLMNDIN